MLLSLLLALQQQPAQAPAPSPVAHVEVTPPAAEVEVGQTIQLSAKALDSAGSVVPSATLQYFINGDEGTVDSTGLVTAGYRGQMRVAVVASVKGAKPAFGEAIIKVKPLAASKIEVTPALSHLMVGSRLTLTGVAYSKQGDQRDDAVTFTSSNSKIVTVSADGRLSALAPGKATITAKAGAATHPFDIQVSANRVARLSIDPATSNARTGDVIRFKAAGKDAAGKAVEGVVVRWAVAETPGVAQVDGDGAFVAETPGTYTITATLGGQNSEAVVQVTQREVRRGLEVQGRVPLAFRGAEAWVHPNGQCVYMSTIADRVYAINVSDPKKPAIVDSMMTNSRIVNDVMTTEDGKYGVFSREGASDRKNGIVVFDASDACHPKPISEYTSTVSGGVHSSYVYQGHVYLTDDATGSMRVIDIRDPKTPKEVARWQTEQTEAGRYLHDIMVVDGLAYLAYWNDGLVILDVGNGMKGGSPEAPKLVSQFKYDLSSLYARVEGIWGLSARGTHTAWKAGKYVFVGDEVYAAKDAKGLQDGNDLTFGRLHVIDVSNIEHPKEVAWYEPTDGGVHNVWVVGDTLYLGNYQGGARVLDISGELKGDLLRQGREISWILTADSLGFRPRSTFAWGAVVNNGNIYVPDINTGLWILKVEPKQETLTP
jgi:uncharacterized protein YjdB